MAQPGEDQPNPAGLKGVGIFPVLQSEVVGVMEIPEEDVGHADDGESSHHNHKD